ncbi:MAG: glycosyltransferase family 4 protein [Vicinamibacterales bacterium]
MRVAMIVRGGLHPSGRHEVVPVLLSLLTRLARHHEVHAFAVDHLPAPAHYTLSGFSVHDLGRPSARFGSRLAAQWRALDAAIDEQGPFDLVHGLWGDPAGVLAVRAARRRGLPSVVTCDSGEFVSLPDIGYGTQRTWFGRRRIAAVCRDASVVHVCTPAMAAAARAWGADPCVIPMGVAVPEDAPRAIDGPPWRLLQVASLSAVKNPMLAVEAMAVLARTHEVVLDLVGADTLGGAVQAHAASLGLAGRVHAHGFVPHDALEAFYRGAHLYLQTSRHEAAGVSVLEAAAAGVPIVGTRTGYLAEWDERGAARAVGVPSPDGLAHDAAVLLDAPAERLRLAATARDWVRAHDADWTASRIDALYQELATSTARTVMARPTTAG